MRIASMRTSVRARALIAIALVVLPAAAPAEARLIRSLSVQPFFFSPSEGDTVTLRFQLNSAATVSLFVLEADSTTVVDTLLAGAMIPTGLQSRGWRGEYFDGSPAPEDTFVAFLRAQSATESDSLFSPRIFIDNTFPQVTITLVDPAVIAPGSVDPGASEDVEITYLVSDPPPTDSVEVDVVVRGPDDSEVATLPEKLVAAQGSAKSIWDGENAQDDGVHSIEVVVRDRASKTASSMAYVEVEVSKPTISFTSLSSNRTLNVIPDSLSGWAWDRSGLRDTIWVEQPGSDQFVRVPSSFSRADTIFFTASLKDSIDEDGTYSLRFKALDTLGQQRIESFTITLDSSPPSPPILDEPSGVSHTPNYVLDGTVSGGVDDVMRVYRNGALADTLFPNLPGQWPHVLTLVPGLNGIWAIVVDDAGNASVQSNTVEVTFDPSAGLYIPQPFRPGDAFQMNVSGAEGSVTVRIYDLGGHLVRVLEERSAGEFVSLIWNGKNGDGEAVKKGPLVAVAREESASGGDDVIRKIFLFEP
jgi:hypothetical protein